MIYPRHAAHFQCISVHAYSPPSPFLYRDAQLSNLKRHAWIGTHHILQVVRVQFSQPALDSYLLDQGQDDPGGISHSYLLDPVHNQWLAMIEASRTLITRGCERTEYVVFLRVNLGTSRTNRDLMSTRHDRFRSSHHALSAALPHWTEYPVLGKESRRI